MPGKVGFEIYSIPPFRDLQMRFARASKQILEDKREIVRAGGRRMVKLMQEEAPQGRTGKYKKKIKFRSFVEGSAIGFRVYVPEPLTTWIVEGTKPHPIPAVSNRGAKTLRFLWEKGPRSSGTFTGFHFFKRVMHPGTKPNPYIGRAFRRWLPGAKSDLTRISTRFVRTIQGSGTAKFHGGRRVG